MSFPDVSFTALQAECLSHSMPEVDQYNSDFAAALQNTHNASNTTSNSGFLTNPTGTSRAVVDPEAGVGESGATSPGLLSSALSLDSTSGTTTDTATPGGDVAAEAGDSTGSDTSQDSDSPATLPSGRVGFSAHVETTAASACAGYSWINVAAAAAVAVVGGATISLAS